MKSVRLEIERSCAQLTADQAAALARDLATLIVSLLHIGDASKTDTDEPSPHSDKTKAA